MTTSSLQRATPLSQPAVYVAGVRLSAAAFSDTVDWLIESVVTGAQPYALRLTNSYCVSLAQHDVRYAQLLSSPRGINLPDGKPVFQAMRGAAQRGGLTVERVRGPSFFTAAFAASQRTAVRHYLLGGTSATLDKLVTTLRTRYPGAQVVGSYSPPFAPVDDAYVEDCRARIDAVGANLVWVGLGTPKQDHVAQLVRDRAKLWAVGVGAAFDFAAGTQPEAPPWMQRAGLEWTFRLATEPRRLWRRYLFGNARFLASLATRGVALEPVGGYPTS